MFGIIDKMANAWINWRIERDAKASPDYKHFMTLDKMEINVREKMTEIVAAGPAVIALAMEAGDMLKAAGAENFLEIELLTRAPVIPIRLRIEKLSKAKSPGQVVAELKQEMQVARFILAEALSIKGGEFDPDQDLILLARKVSYLIKQGGNQ